MPQDAKVIRRRSRPLKGTPRGTRPLSKGEPTVQLAAYVPKSLADQLLAAAVANDRTTAGEMRSRLAASFKGPSPKH